MSTGNNSLSVRSFSFQVKENANLNPFFPPVQFWFLGTDSKKRPRLLTIRETRLQEQKSLLNIHNKTHQLIFVDGSTGRTKKKKKILHGYTSLSLLVPWFLEAAAAVVTPPLFSETLSQLLQRPTAAISKSEPRSTLPEDSPGVFVTTWEVGSLLLSRVRSQNGALSKHTGQDAGRGVQSRTSRINI